MAVVSFLFFRLEYCTGKVLATHTKCGKLAETSFSYGQLGNQNTNQWYPTYRTMTLGILDGGWLQNGTKPNTAKVGDLISTVLTWEKYGLGILDLITAFSTIV